MELLCASRLTQRAAAQAQAPPVLSLVPNTLATSPLPPSYPPATLPRVSHKQASLSL